MVRLLLSIIFWHAAVAPAMAQSDRVVALIVSVGEGGPRADAIQAQLQVMGAETLRSASPNNAEFRAMLRRFAAEAVNARASLVYLDAPAVSLDGRQFVLPAAAAIDRPTDLLTRAIPLSAFARAAAQSEQGGAVLVAVGARPGGLPEALPAVERAPEPLAGAGPVLIARYGASDPIVRVIAAATAAAASEEAAVDLGDLLTDMAAADGVDVSSLPAGPILLKAPKAAGGAGVAVSDVIAGADAARSVEELRLLEQSLSRSAKRTLQRGLRDLGHYNGFLDGIFGPQTRQAILDFQAERSEAQTGFLSGPQLMDLF